jgi:hypothetical protein
MHGVHAQATGAPVGLRPPPFPIAPWAGLVRAKWSRRWRSDTLSQPVNLGHRDRGQPLVVGVAKIVILPFQNVPGGRSAQRLVRVIHRRQEFQIQRACTAAQIRCRPVATEFPLPIARGVREGLWLDLSSDTFEL